MEFMERDKSKAFVAEAYSNKNGEWGSTGIIPSLSKMFFDLV